MEIAAGRSELEFAPFASEFMARRHGIDGNAYLRLVQLLDTGLLEALSGGRDIPTKVRVALRKNLFRGAPVAAFHADLRLKGFPRNDHSQVWEPSPFIAWLSLRPLLTDTVLNNVAAVAGEANEIAANLLASASCRGDELLPIAILARALAVFVERSRILVAAQEFYRQAAATQHSDPAGFEAKLADSADLLETLRSGILVLRRAVDELDACSGLDAGERHWLEVHEQSLDTHISALRALRANGDSLLEFGEFLRRPAHITGRLTWR
jgi:hypothetical protein